MKIRYCLLVLMICINVVTAFLFPRSISAETCEQWIAKVVSVQGSVQARGEGEMQWKPVKLNDTYCPGDIIRVLERSRAEVILVNEPVLRLDQNTTIIFSGLEKKQTSLIDLLKGAVHFFSRFPRALKVLTAFVNAGVEGTEFFIRVESNRTFLTIFEGQVVATNEAGSLTLMSGQSAVAEAGKAPVLQVVVRPRDAVQWALYYPIIIYYQVDEFPVGPPTYWQTMVRTSIEFYRKGDLTSAFSSIEKIPEDIRDPRFFTYRASLLLSVGRIDEAEKDIERALNLEPVNSLAFALKSVIAVVQNEKEKALTLAKKAVEADLHSASARIALSYAQQAHFDLKGALTSLKEAVKLQPKNALAWARLAELWLSFGELDEALKAAKKAVELNPDMARTQSVLGFAYLTKINIRESKVAFEKAIELDQADPLPRLGLGLAKIREGDLKGGRRQIEIAAGLDPDNSLLRSYLGKAYFEEKRDELSSDQFVMAKDFDSLDPTPYFYDAILKQSINRPVEALHDMQKAIELNDNRAVYRSKLLLDSDLAARSASLARIYTDLGFQQLALVEGWKSVNEDPGNYSAHRFLADTYSALPRHEIARVSELLQSQLLQPINITPVQPSLAEANLFILNGAGPSYLSFNEFNPLFNRNRLALQLSGVAGGNSTLGNELVFSGVQGNVSFSIGQYHYETDGFRTNNDQKQDIYNVFAQVSLSNETSIQAEFRSTDIKKGDLELRFNPENFSPNLRQDEETKSFRLGMRHAFNPNSILIASLIYKNLDATAHEVLPFSTFDISVDENAYMAEIQHLFRSEYINFISGAGHFKTDRKDTIKTGLFNPPLTLSDVTKSDVRHTNLYFYSQVNYPKNVTLTVGASADLFDGRIEDRDQFNPKFGLTYNPLPTTTLRAAVFRVLKRSLISSQTLEPTQVVGFNQFFEDTEGTRSWRYGIGIDQKFSPDIYGGVEYSRRDLEVPFLGIPLPPEPPVVKVYHTDWKEQLGRAYLYWTPRTWLVVGAEYQYEQFKRGEFVGTEEIHISQIHRVPIKLNFYHPSGFSTRLTATYVHQNGEFGDPLMGTLAKDSDKFWVFDASLSYRLPKRFGIITIEARNLFNNSFKFQDTDPANPAISPKRLIFAKVTLAF